MSPATTQKVAAIQMTSGPEVAANLRVAGRLLALAAKAGAKLAVLPENFGYIGPAERDRVAVRETPGAGPQQDFLAEQAARHGMWLVGGTVPLACADPDRVLAACLVFDEGGRQVARYDKLHLFDVKLPESSECYAESSAIMHGSGAIVVVDSPCGRLGLAVCYDLRFPELFRAMHAHQVELVALPAAFTATSGRAHWEVLVRARAIENLIYMVAAAQGGRHADGRETFGDSLIVEPWGAILDRHQAQSPGLALADVDRSRVARLRQEFPALEHRRLAGGALKATSGRVDIDVEDRTFLNTKT